MREARPRRDVEKERVENETRGTDRVAGSYCAIALAIAARQRRISGATLLGKNASTLPSLPTRYLLKFQAGRSPVVPRNA